MKVYLVTLRNAATDELREYEVEADTALEAQRNAALDGWVWVATKPALWSRLGG